jgi:hypothetical protein
MPGTINRPQRGMPALRAGLVRGWVQLSTP